jgi:GLPGLI family protein
MKTIKHIGSFLMATFACITLLAQQPKRLTEATITYDIVINAESTEPNAASLLDGATSVIYLKGNSSRSEMISSLGNQATIIDGKTGNVTELREYGDQRYMIKMTAANWKESNKKSDGIVYTYFEEYKTIAGYKCQKAVGKMNDGTEITVFFTKDLLLVNKDFQYINKNLPGLAMQYEAKLRKGVATYTVSSINFNPVAQIKFDLPKSGYRIMTYEESKGK